MEGHQSQRCGEHFAVDNEVLLYDVTITYFEGEAEAEGNVLDRRGYSRDHRPDRKQVCIALVVTFDGFPLGYELFAGNTHDGRTVQTIVDTMEARHGTAGRVWTADRGMSSAANLAWLSQTGQRYIIGVPKVELRKFAAELAAADGWQAIRYGIEVKLAPWPETSETAILCRSADRRTEERVMHDKFSNRIGAALARLAERIESSRKRLNAAQINRQIGRILQRNQCSAARFRIAVQAADCPAGLRLHVDPDQAFGDWAALCAAHEHHRLERRAAVARLHPAHPGRGCLPYPEGRAAAAPDPASARRSQAHVLVCILAFVLWKCLEMWQQRAGLGNSPRTVLEE